MIHPHLSGYSKSANNTFTIAEPTTTPNPTPTIQGVKDATTNNNTAEITDTLIIKFLKKDRLIPLDVITSIIIFFISCR